MRFLKQKDWEITHLFHNVLGFKIKYHLQFSVYHFYIFLIHVRSRVTNVLVSQHTIYTPIRPVCSLLAKGLLESYFIKSDTCSGMPQSDKNSIYAGSSEVKTARFVAVK